ncbi:MAG: radical SAM protein [Bacteroidales bacterium]|nr:radical SAM protein [Bacteroidales bacterium]
MTEYIQSKTILSRLNDAPDPYFGITWNMNLYRGCQHQCIYCDSRSVVYRMGDLAHIRIKENAIDLLDRELRGKRKKGTIGTGSMNDPYMPVEKAEKLTRRALEKIAAYRFPVHVLTKSDLVNRDTDLLKEIGKVYSAVSFTITTCSDELARKIEPGAPVSSKRFAALEKIANSGIYTGIILSPVLLFLTDKEENIAEMVRKASDAGASYLLGWMGMTQREGQREYFYLQLDQHFPGIKEQYDKQFGLNYQCSSPRALRLYQVLREKCDQYGIALKMRIYAENPPDQLSLF